MKHATTQSTAAELQSDRRLRLDHGVPARGSGVLVRGHLYLCFAALLCGAVWSSTGSSQILAFVLMACVLWTRWAPELSQPLVWFIPPYALYSVSYPVMCLFGLYSYDEAVQRSLSAHAVGMLAFAIPLLWLVRQHPRFRILSLRERAGEFSAEAVLAFAVPIVIMGMVLVISLGATSKRDLANSGSIVTTITQTGMLVAFVSGTILLAVRFLSSRTVPLAAWILALLAALALLYLGERDYLARLAVSFILLTWDTRRKPRMTTAIMLGLTGFALLPLLQSMKAVAIGSPFTYTFDLMALFGQEFRSMGQNTWMIVVSEGPAQVHGPAAIAMELKRTFASDLLGLRGTSLTSWFNETYFGSSIAGRGFSMVGAAYLMGGIAGVATLYAMAGILFGWLYAMRGVSIYRLSIYVLLAPTFVYSQRADFSNFIGPGVKTTLIPVLIIALAAELIMSYRHARQGSADDGFRAQTMTCTDRPGTQGSSVGGRVGGSVQQSEH